MQGFLEQLANKLYRQYGEEISSLNVMFPSRRAHLFFGDSLSKLVDKPIWQPKYISMDEVMGQIADVSIGEHIKLIVELYNIYSKYHNEHFDTFFFWGEMLLADFDAIDKYMIDAQMLFRNVSDLKELQGDLSYLDPEQIEVISSFWRSFGLESNFSDEQRGFVKIWSTLGEIYTSYKSRLKELGIAYSGMMYREAAERVKEGGGLDDVELQRYVIAGFNALSTSEKVVIDYLCKNSHVDIFWDYDNYYVENREQEAGMFVRENLKRYSHSMTNLGGNDSFSKKKNITIVDAPSDSMQCKYVAEYLTNIRDKIGRIPNKESAIVLTDENLMLPVLYSVPSFVEDINITMGYPLRQTLVYSFTERLIELHNRRRKKGNVLQFYHSDVTGILTHPFIVEIDKDVVMALSDEVVRKQQIYTPLEKLTVGGVTDKLFKNIENWQDLSDYILDICSSVSEVTDSGDFEGASRLEFLNILCSHLEQLKNSLIECNLELTTSTYISLLRRLLQSIRIPYDGEPLAGVQIMGILETRNLDFDNVLILSVNDDTFPGNRASSSFIPHNLRYAYGIPTPAHHEGVYAYYFYRLLQRATNIDIVYSSKSDEKSSGERSRYIHQLIYESKHNIKQISLGIDVNTSEVGSIVVEKRGVVLDQLQSYFNSDFKSISPTALYSYLDCPLKFYFRTILGIRDRNNSINDEIDSPMFGTILHRAIQELYSPLIDMESPGATIKKLINTYHVSNAVTIAINDKFLNDPSNSGTYSGDIELMRDIITKYLNKCLLPYDAAQDGYTIKALEKKIKLPFEVDVCGDIRRIFFEGIADRIDMIEGGVLRIVDYKSGRVKSEFKGVDGLFSDVREERSSEALQTFIYAMIASEGGRRSVQPALYYVRHMNSADFTPLLYDSVDRSHVVDYATYRERFEKLLAGCVREIFDPQVAFNQCDDSSVCAYCDYSQICQRK